MWRFDMYSNNSGYIVRGTAFRHYVFPVSTEAAASVETGTLATAHQIINDSPQSVASYTYVASGRKYRFIMTVYR